MILKSIAAFAIVLALLLGNLTGTDTPTSLSEAQHAIDANLKTSEGKTFDDRMGTDFVQKHMESLRGCKQAAAGDFRSFWILLKLNSDGSAKELLFYPDTKINACAHGGLLKEKFLAPPRPDYWVGIYFKISR